MKAYGSIPLWRRCLLSERALASRTFYTVPLVWLLHAHASGTSGVGYHVVSRSLGCGPHAVEREQVPLHFSEKLFSLSSVEAIAFRKRSTPEEIRCGFRVARQ